MNAQRSGDGGLQCEEQQALPHTVMAPAWLKMVRSSSVVVDHGMLPTYRRVVVRASAIVADEIEGGKGSACE